MRTLIAAIGGVLFSLLPGAAARAQSALEAVIYIIDAREPGSTTIFEESGKTLNVYSLNSEKKPFSLSEITQLDGCKYRVRWGSDNQSKYVKDLRAKNAQEFTLDFSRADVDRITMHQADKYRRFVKFTGLKVCSVNDEYQTGVPVGECRNDFYAHPGEPERKAKAAKHIMANFCKARGF
jgi:hypothetical protein